MKLRIWSNPSRWLGDPADWLATQITAGVEVRSCETGENLPILPHDDVVLDMAWSSDGERLATVTPDGTTRVWHVDTGRQLLALRGPRTSVTTLAWSWDGRRLATGERPAGPAAARGQPAAHRRDGASRCAAQASKSSGRGQHGAHLRHARHPRPHPPPRGLAPGRGGSMKVARVAETHVLRRCGVARRGWRGAGAAPTILHAVVVGMAEVLEELTQYAPVIAVLEQRRPGRLPAGAPRRPPSSAWMARRGHAARQRPGQRPAGADAPDVPARGPRGVRQLPHIPLDQASYGLRIFNPGSPTDRRRQPHGTLGLLRIDFGVLAAAAIVPVT